MKFVLDLTSFEEKTKEIRAVLARPMLFVSGAPKSGTTWVQKSLDAHPQILCSGEGHFVNSLVHAFQQSIQFYNDQLATVSDQVYQGAPCYKPFDDENKIYIARSMVALMLANSHRAITPQTIYVGDKTPAHALYMPQLYTLFPHAKFIHIIRDVRDVVVSTIKHAERINRKPIDRSVYIQDITQRWLQYNRIALDFGKQRPQQFHWLRYWELLYDFEPTFQKILDFLSVENTPEIIAHCQANADFKTLSGGRERGEEDISSFFRKGIRGDWKNHLSEQEHDEILSLC